MHEISSVSACHQLSLRPVTEDSNDTASVLTFFDLVDLRVYFVPVHNRWRSALGWHAFQFHRLAQSYALTYRLLFEIFAQAWKNIVFIIIITKKQYQTLFFFGAKIALEK